MVADDGKKHQSNISANSFKSICNGLIAGYSAGLCGIVVGHPLDSIKVLLQTKRGACSHVRQPSSSYSGAADTAITRASKSSPASPSSSNKANVSTAAVSSRMTTQEIISTRSLRALYAGMAGPLLASGAIRSFNFCTYDFVRRWLYLRDLRHDNCNPQHGGRSRHDDYLHCDPLGNVAIASFLSGASTSLFTSPMALVKTKQQIMVWGFKQTALDTYYHGSSNKANCRSMLRGIANFYTGFGVHFTCDAIGTAVYFTSYEFFKRQIACHSQSREQHVDTVTTTNHLSLPQRMICAAFAGMACWSVIFPCDVVRSRLYSQSLTNETSLNALQLASKMVKEEGLGSLYRGVGITVARAGPVAAAVLPVYDVVLERLSRP